MAIPTYDLIETTTLTSSASSVTFTSITQDYRDLVLVTDFKATDGTRLRFNLNNDSSANYFQVHMEGDGTSTGSGTIGSLGYFTTTNAAEADLTNALFSITQFLDYSATDKHKSILIRANSGSDTGVEAIAARYASTSGITTINLEQGGKTFSSGSTFSLYGIAS